MLSRRRTPLMGWNSWNAFRCYEINEEVILAQAEALVSLGLAEAGFRTVVVDDGCQAVRRDRNGDLQACPRRFPSGMRALGDRLHAMGLQYGLYLAPGRRTCAQYWDAYGWLRWRGAAIAPPAIIRRWAAAGTLPARPAGRDRLEDLGSYGREQKDLDRLVSWGIDLLKYDWCRAERGTDLCEHAGPFADMSALIASADREIHYSISEYGLGEPWRRAPRIAHSWRTTADISRTAESVLTIARETARHAEATGPGRVQDPDMLQVGNLDSATLDRTHLLLWAMLAAPLMIGCDLRGRRHDDPEIVALRDRTVLEIDQDPLVRSARRVDGPEGTDCYRRELEGGHLAVAVVNPQPTPRTVPVPSAAADRRWSTCRVDGAPVDARVGELHLPGYGAALLSTR